MIVVRIRCDTTIFNSARAQIPGLEDPMRRPWQPLHYSCLENPHGQRSMVGTVHMVAKSRTQLSTAQHVQLDGYY